MIYTQRNTHWPNGAKAYKHTKYKKEKRKLDNAGNGGKKDRNEGRT